MNNQTPARFHVLAKPTGAICNLACSYCFFLDKELLYPGSPFRMSDEVLENYIRQLIEGHRTLQVTVAWQGGEPTLMGLDFYRRAIELQNKNRKPGMTFENTMQTNGTLLNDEWCAFFKENNFLIGISIDGPRELHDAYRVNKGGAGTFDQVMRGLRLLQKHGVEYNVLTTVNRLNADYPLEGFGPNAVHHLRRTDSFPNCPDILVNSFYDPVKDEGCAFEELIGFHGGMGGTQTHPFVLHPVDLQAPDGDLIGAASVHELGKSWLQRVQGTPAS